MKAENLILNTYWSLLKNLSDKLKMSLIDQLRASISDKNKSEELFLSAFGAWKDDKDAEEIISEIRSARFRNREIENL